MTDPMPYRCPAIEPGMGVLERCILNVGHGGGFHLAAGAWPVEGSTPLDSPTSARCAHCTAAIGVNEMFSVMDGCRHRLCSRCLDQDHECAAAPAGEVASGDVVEAIMDTIHAYPGPVAGRTGAHVERLIREYAAGQRAEGVEDGRRLAGEVVSVPPPGLREFEDAAWHSLWLQKDWEAVVSVLTDEQRATADAAVERALKRRYGRTESPMPPPAPAPADEPAPVPPPVDARFAEIDDLLWRFTDMWLDGTGQVTVRDRALVETRRLFAAGVAEGRRQATEERTAILTEAYWKLRDHAEDLRSTFVYINAQDRAKEATEAAREGIATGSDGRWREKALGLRSHARGIEAGARDLAHMLGVEEHEIERPAVNHG